MVANATGCSSIWGGSAPATPYTVNHNGHGPAWANSLFEDNAEYGLGMFLGVKAQREEIAALANAAIEANDPAKAELQDWVDNMNEGDRSGALCAQPQRANASGQSELLPAGVAFGQKRRGQGGAAH